MHRLVSTLPPDQLERAEAYLERIRARWNLTYCATPSTTVPRRLTCGCLESDKTEVIDGTGTAYCSRCSAPPGHR